MLLTVYKLIIKPSYFILTSSLTHSKLIPTSSPTHPTTIPKSYILSLCISPCLPRTISTFGVRFSALGGKPRAKVAESFIA